MNSFSYNPDTGNYVYPGPILDRLFDVYSFIGMIIINRIDQITYVGIPAIMLWAVLRRLIPKK